jgi:hypothetical protein
MAWLLYLLLTGGGVDSGNTDFDDPAVIELHRRHLPDRNGNIGTDENVTRSAPFHGAAAHETRIIIIAERRERIC